MVYPQKMHFFSGKYSIDLDSNWKIRVYLSALRYVVIFFRDRLHCLWADFGTDTRWGISFDSQVALFLWLAKVFGVHIFS